MLLRRFVRFTYEYCHITTVKRLVSGSFLLLFRKERERSVAEDEGFAECRHINDGENVVTDFASDA